MFVILHALGIFVAGMLKSRCRLQAENPFLRHQLNVALRRVPSRLRLRCRDRALLIWMTRLWPDLLAMAQVVQPETILRWHRAGFKVFWRWKSRNRAGRPHIDRGLRDLIRRMSRENPLFGASRIHGELLMFGFEVAQSTVSKYIVRPPKPPSQTCTRFLRNHAPLSPFRSWPGYIINTSGYDFRKGQLSVHTGADVVALFVVETKVQTGSRPAFSSFSIADGRARSRRQAAVCQPVTRSHPCAK